MDKLVDNITEELNVQTVFTIPIGNGIPVYESVVVTWIIMAVLVLLSIILVRNLKVKNPNKVQLLLEVGISKIYDFFYDLIGESGKAYIPYLISILLYIGVADIIGLFGFKSPTKDLNVTVALALMSIVLTEYAGFHKKGLKGFVKSFAEPLPVMAPFNVLELVIKPLSLCMRLFGNVLGAVVIMGLIKTVVPLILPIPFSFYFDIFDGLLQAYVFVFLTALYMKEALE